MWDPPEARQLNPLLNLNPALMPETPPRFYLTTPIYYVNARPHIGHAYTTIVADVLARRSRAQGNDTWFLTGTDEHGQKIERSAAAANIPPQQFTDQVSREFKALWDRMGLTYNQYIRTTDEPHKRGVQYLWRELQSRGHIYLSSYTGQYCVSEEIFVEGPPGTLGPDGRPTETVTEENYFFRLSNFQRPLLDLIESNTLKVTPEARRNELLSFLRGPVAAHKPHNPGAPPLASEMWESTTPTEPTGPTGLRPSSFTEPEPTESTSNSHLAYSTLGHPYVPGTLRDLSISRSSFTWGIPVPDDPKHVIYVWLDALANYMTAVGYGDPSPEAQARLARYWPADLHLVGKEIIRQHCIYWPAFLLALNPQTAHTPNHPMPTLSAADHQEWAKLWLPKQVTAHGWLLFEESKMSKSRGNIVRTETILQAFGTLCPPPPTRDVLLKGTASAVPSNPGQDLASAAEAPFSSPELRTPGAPLIAQPHREMSGNSELDSAKSGAPFSSEPHPEENGVSGEARPLSSESPTPHQRDLFAADVLRYFLLREIPFGQDGSFSFEALITRYNADLANGYGNLISRTIKLAHNRHGAVPVPSESDEQASEFFEALDSNQSLVNSLDTLIRVFTSKFDDKNFSGALAESSVFVAVVDSYLSDNAPWKLIKTDDPEKLKSHDRVVYAALESIRIITALLYPILPYATAAVWRQLGLGEIEQAAANGELKNLTWGGLKPGTKLGPLTPIFPRADKGLAQLMANMEQEKTLATQTDAADAATPTTTEFKQAPLASLTGQRHETPAPDPQDPTHPAAPPRTAAFAEPNPGRQVAGSDAHTTERPGTPSHTEAASGIFAGTTAGAPFIPELHPGMSGSTPNSQPSGASPQTQNQITIDDFAKIELRVAQILVCERIPKADKLLRLEVDLGYERRQILSGIAEWYTPEDLIGRRIVVITNLAPRKMRGLESHGMLLAASTDGGKPHLATFTGADDLPLGSRLK